MRRTLAFEALERRELLAATSISVHVAGTTGTEQFQLQIDGAAVATWTNTRIRTAERSYDTFTYTSPADVSIDRIRVAFLNDGAASGGVNRDLFVDGVTVNNAKYETEATSVYSTGAWDDATQGRLPGFRQVEGLQYNGYVQFGAAASTIQVRAAGETGQEQMQLIIGGKVVATYGTIGGNYAARQFSTYGYTHTSAIPLNQVRVAFTNDGATATGADKNLYVDAVILDGVHYETEAPAVFSTGLWTPAQGRTPGRHQIEGLYLAGYFQYAATGSVIDVRAAGRSGEERVELLIGGQTVATFNNVGGNLAGAQYQTFTYIHPTIAPGQIRVAFTNDGPAANGVDRDVRVDAIELDGVVKQAEAADVFNTGEWFDGIGPVVGLWQSEYLKTGGYLQFGSTATPGTLALGTTTVSVNEAAGTVSIPVTRTGGSDGTVAVRHDGECHSDRGSDSGAAALVVFGPGETSGGSLPILNDAIPEGNETFHAAIDKSLAAPTSAPAYGDGHDHRQRRPRAHRHGQRATGRLLPGLEFHHARLSAHGRDRQLRLGNRVARRVARR
jgi:hypothetical protein